MLLRKAGIVLIFSFITVFAQSIDEEESVHVGGSEGSGNGLTDDEDIEGSALPPDTFYATTPQVRPKFSSSTTRVQTTTKRISTFATSTPRIVTSPRMITEPTSTDSRPSVPFDTSTFFGTQGICIILGVILALLSILIICILCFRAKSERQQAYRPGQRESPDALLKE